MAKFILIHGGMHGSWCWELVVPRMERAGHRAETIDLLGNDGATDPALVTLEAWTGQIATALEDGPGQSVLVAHSMGGLPATTAASRVPARVAALVYLCAVVPEDGRASAAGAASRAAADRFVSADDGRTQSFHREQAREMFYADCEPAVADAALDRLTPQPTGPLSEPPRIDGGRLARLRRHYIHTTLDRAISPAVQRGYIASVPGMRVHEMATGHSPFYAAPDELTQLLIEIADVRDAGQSQ